MNPRRYRSNRPGGTRQAGPPRGGGGRKPRVDLPVLLGEPSPSLARILRMNGAQLREKIKSLDEEERQLIARLQRLNKLDDPPAEKIKIVADLLKRLEALRAEAERRLAERGG